MKYTSFIILLFLQLSLHAQTRERWEQVVNWDGVSNWSRYMITLPAYQGPNSLPVPQLGNGRIDSNTYLGIYAAAHFMPGDKTQNLVLHGHVGLVKDVVDVEVIWIPYEHFNMSTAVKEKRHVYYEYFNETHAMGEMWMNTNFRIFKKWEKTIDLLLQVGFRFPSGTDYGAARYSDGPGYHFAINAGKNLNASKTLRLTGMAGFHVWQVESDIFKQDDSFLFGAGLEWEKKGFRLRTDISGYLGYLEHQGDKPIVIRAQVQKQLGKQQLYASLRQGIQDFEYTSAELGIRLGLKKRS